MKPIIKSLKEYKSAKNISGPLLLIEGVEDVSYGELVEISTGVKEKRLGKVLEVFQDKALIQVFEGTSGLSTNNIKIRFTGKGIRLGVSPKILGRVFTG